MTVSEGLGRSASRLEHTLRLQVAVNETHQVQIFQSSRHFRGVKSCCIFVDAFVRSSLQRAEEFAATAVLHTEI